MALQDEILNAAKAIINKYNYSSDPVIVRKPNGALNYEDSYMDCSEFILYSTKQASTSLYNKLIAKKTTPEQEDSGNTTTIKAGIKGIEGISDLSKLSQTNPKKGDWIIWEGHLEIIQELTLTGGYMTLGANGADNSYVPKNITCKNFESVKKIATNFLGIWTPKV